MGCPYLPECPFFTDQLAQTPRLPLLCKVVLCKGDFTNCARYRLALLIGIDGVPHDLMPFALRHYQKPNTRECLPAVKSKQQA
jgi:hypothetical protein